MLGKTFLLLAMATAAAATETGTTVKYNGRMYGTLAGVPVEFNGTDELCQTDYLPVPSGCVLAPDTPEVRANVVAAHTWSTAVMVLANGKGINTKAMATPGGEASGGMLDTSGGTYKPTVCSLQVLYECALPPTTNPTPGPTANPTPPPTSPPTPGPTASPTLEPVKVAAAAFNEVLSSISGKKSYPTTDAAGLDMRRLKSAFASYKLEMRGSAVRGVHGRAELRVEFQDAQKIFAAAKRSLRAVKRMAKLGGNSSVQTETV